MDGTTSSDEAALDPARVAKGLRRGWPVQFTGLDITHCRILGRNFCFATDMEHDPIQRNHRRGQFYEMAELEQIKSLFPFNGTFVDIGANVGNHSLFVAGFMQPARVVPFEPNPQAYKLLLANIALNGLRECFDFRGIGFGVADQAQTGFGMEDRSRNLGAAKMLAGQGDIATVQGDEALADLNPDMIKIDTEGMELLVLRGLEGTLERCAPLVLVEVDNENEAAFLAWMAQVGYEPIKKMQRYRLNKNYLIRRAKKGAAGEH